MRFVIVTGVSGAGKSLVVKYLEDEGFFCVDNLPPALLPKFAEVCLQGRDRLEKVALVIDARGKKLLKDLLPELELLNNAGVQYEILFLEATDNVLIKRFKESRRSHPLAPEGRVLRGIQEERFILSDIKKKAHHVIDTTHLTPKQLKHEIVSIFVENRNFEGMIINIISFGFKYGIPIDCDLVFDVRFIPNPYYIDSMKKQSGKHPMVSEYVMGSEETITFMAKLSDMLEFLIPNYIKEGKSQLVIGIGCTGGKHRSVAIGDALHVFLQGKGHRVIIDHRDLDKDNRGAKK